MGNNGKAKRKPLGLGRADTKPGSWAQESAARQDKARRLRKPRVWTVRKAAK